ncbi:putative F-box protein PP2-B2 [Primulina eburnea]|uniref:putative F-box protein PP2-B2 n=1 Tax=Primulina eburnea TaxID=1245227 RepID=UPI003C6BD69D
MGRKSCGDINDLPQDCLVKVLSFTTPKDACRLSAVSSTFRLAAESDSLWELFLPSDYRDIISRSIDGSDSLPHEFQSKRDLYLRLSDHPIVIDSGHKSFNLEKWSGKKCYMLAPRDLFINWVSQRWKWITHPDSRFSEVAELTVVSWFGIRGCIKTEMLSFDTDYAAYLVFTTNSTTFGFDDVPAEAYVGIKGFEMKKRSVYLKGDTDTEFLTQREDGWMEVELGECFVKGGEDVIVMTLLEVKRLNQKRGLVIQGMEIRPKKCI